MTPRPGGRGATAALLLLLAACSPGDDATGTLSPDEDRQLNDAAAMLDANSVALEDAPENGTDRP